ncbi:MAG: HAMP domain-containing protein [Opitutales bacterium]|nr:HAMP domain-containing protein [Opitutales bacterium]
MKRLRIFYFLWPSYLLIAVIALVSAGIYTGKLYHETTVEAVQSELTSVAYLVRENVTTALDEERYEWIDGQTNRMGTESGYRITIILPDGHVVGDSEKPIKQLGLHNDRPEIIDALQGKVGVITRYSETIRRDLMYVAVVVEKDGKALGIVRVSKPVASIDEMLAQARSRILAFCFFGAILSAILGWLLAKRISLPLEQIRDWAENFTRKNLRRRIPSSSIREIDVMAQTINEMAEQLQDRLQTILEQQDEEKALFPNMIEGVFMVDKDRRLTKINASAAKLFNAPQEMGTPLVIESSIRNPEILNMVSDVLKEKHLVQNEIYLAEKDKYLQVNANILPGAAGQPRGALFVINDITSIRKMELMHRNFVADVSHELKTPITSVIGFSETLLESPDMGKEDQEHFLGIINRQANRLKNIVEDLLMLTGLEHGIDSGKIELYHTPLKSVLESAAQCCLSKAEKKSITVKVSSTGNPEVEMDVHLFEQAIMNLTENAIKYSPEGSTVDIQAEAVKGKAVIRVKDTGCGISKEHHEHLFDRFYVVDKSRSRKLGGTGLGLAIVKHIVMAHKGSITVDSTAGKGSCFTITLPLSAGEA